MKDKRKPSLRSIGRCIGFFAVFLTILTALTLIYIPKWDGLDGRLMRNFYAEEENTIDVLMLGSCNMYTSFWPTVAYDEYGMTSAVFAGPDQEIMTSYYYLKDAIKTQDVKVVALEALFLTCEPTPKREYYDRTAVEYMPPSLNKAKLIIDLGGFESEYMQSVDPSSPNKLLTYAGYYFPLLRYHGREDITEADRTFYSEREDAMPNHGASPYHNYLINDSVDFADIKNGDEIRDISAEYILKIRDLCEEEGIQFVLVKSPNYWRWDEETTALVRDFAEENGIEFLDMHDYDNWLLSDFSQSTGRLNSYGMKKFTEYMCEYILENMPYEPSVLSEETIADWEADVAAMYEYANNKGMTLDPGQIYYVRNTTEGICLTWNHADNAESYSVYRADGESGDFEKIDTTDECVYVDTTAEPLKGYTYRIEPDDGAMAGVASNECYYVFVEAPENFEIESKDEVINLDWDKADSVASYYVQRKTHADLNYEYWDTLDETEWQDYKNYTYDFGTHYDYRLRAVYEHENGESYYSGSAVAEIMVLPTPEITSVEEADGALVVSWNDQENVDSYEVYRKAEGEESFTLCGTVDEENSYKDADVKPGVKYSYKVAAVKTSYDYVGRSDRSSKHSGKVE